MLRWSGVCVKNVTPRGRGAVVTARQPLATVHPRSLSYLAMPQLCKHTPRRQISAHPSLFPPPQIFSRPLTLNSAFYSFVHCVESGFQALHSSTHLPWWAVILSSTVLLRSILTLPLAVYQNRLLAKMELLLPTLKEYQEAVKHNLVVKCRRDNVPLDKANRRITKAAKSVARDLYSQEGCNPYKVAALPWVQIPLWITISFTLRNMAGVLPGSEPSQQVKAAMASEGCLWFSDLTVPDPYQVLPLLLVATNLGNVELHALRRQTPSRTRRIFTNSIRVLSVGLFFVASQMPAAMSLYWSVSSTYGLLQNILFKFPRVRRGLNIPWTPSESRTPFKDLWAIVQDKARAFTALQR